MIIEKLHSIFNFTEATLLHTNDQYDFTIKKITPANEDYILLITDGLSKYSQPVNENNKNLEHIELYFMLPDYWDLKQNNWPVTWLNRIACVPQKNKTWFGKGDTVPAGNPPEEIDLKLKASYFLIGESIELNEELSATATGNFPIQMLAVIPIFKREFDFKMQNSATLLFNKLKEKNYTERIDEYRQPVARKKFMGLF